MNAPDPQNYTPVERIGVTPTEAAAITGLGRTTIFRLIADGVIASKLVGRRRVVLVRSLRQFLEGDRSAAGTAA
jgi:excisionase family DNA binding protein